MRRWGLALFLGLLTANAWARPEVIQAARARVGDLYDAGYYAGGPPPAGRGACPEVIYYGLLAVGIDLQREVESDILAHPGLYPNRRDRNIDYRWCPNLIVWFRRHTRVLPPYQDWRPGDIVFWSLLGDGVADHVGLVSDRKDHRGKLLVIHNLGPRCSEDAALSRWPIVGHFRLR